MRCKKHVADQSRTIGVCASCLRERLEELREAQGEAQAQAQTNSARDTPPAAATLSSSSRKPGLELEPNPPPLNNTRSVFPYVSQKKSNRRLDRRFYSTPPVDGPAVCNGGKASSKAKHGRFWNLLNLFRFKSKKPESSSQESCDPPPSSSAPVSPPWHSAIPVVKRENDDAAADGACGMNNTKSDRGTDNLSDEFEGRDRSSTQISPPECSPRRQNLTAEASPMSVRRSRTGLARKTARSLAFCLSPLVRATPSRQWSHKGLGLELGGHGHGPGPVHKPSFVAPSLCANRSRKLADFGRGCRHR